MTTKKGARIKQKMIHGERDSFEDETPFQEIPERDSRAGTMRSMRKSIVPESGRRHDGSTKASVSQVHPAVQRRMQRSLSHDDSEEDSEDVALGDQRHGRMARGADHSSGKGRSWVGDDEESPLHPAILRRQRRRNHHHGHDQGDYEERDSFNENEDDENDEPDQEQNVNDSEDEREAGDAMLEAAVETVDTLQNDNREGSGAIVAVPVQDLTAVDVKAVDQVAERTRTRKKLLTITVIVLTLLGTVVTLSVLLSSKSKSDPVFAMEQADTPSPTPQSTRTPEPTRNRTVYDYTLLEVKAVILEDGFSDPKVFDDPDSPQSMALDILSRQGKESKFQRTTKLLLQRYGFLMFFLAMGGQQWDSIFRHQDPSVFSNECLWPVVTCNAKRFVIGVDIWDEGGPDKLLRGITGQIPNEIAYLFELKELRADNETITGTLPTTIGLLSKLETLSLSGNQLRGEIPSTISKLDRLVELNLGGNSGLSGTLPIDIGECQKLRELNISGAKLDGRLPDSFENLTNLRDVDFSNNVLSGPFPTVLGKLVNITSLDLSGNSLNSIPPSIYNLTRLEEFRIERNALTGTIDSAIGNLVSLRTLAVSENYLSGQIPAEVGLLANLEYLDFANNRFNGTIPTADWTDLGRLSHVRLQENNFSGSIECENVLLFLEGLVIDCEKVTCECCTADHQCS